MGEVFCSQPPAQLVGKEAGEEVPEGTGASASGSGRAKTQGAAADKPKYVGLVVCQRRGAAPTPRAGVLAAQGMRGAAPLLTRLHLIREFGTLQHPNNHGQPEGG